MILNLERILIIGVEKAKNERVKICFFGLVNESDRIGGSHE